MGGREACWVGFRFFNHDGNEAREIQSPCLAECALRPSLSLCVSSASVLTSADAHALFGALFFTAHALLIALLKAPWEHQKVTTPCLSGMAHSET